METFQKSRDTELSALPFLIFYSKMDPQNSFWCRFSVVVTLKGSAYYTVATFPLRLPFSSTTGVHVASLVKYQPPGVVQAQHCTFCSAFPFSGYTLIVWKLVT